MRKKYYKRSSPINEIKFKEAVSKFQELNSKLLVQNEHDFYANLNKSDPKIWNKIDRHRNGNDKPVIQPLIVKKKIKRGEEEIEEEVILHTDEDINNEMIKTHITRQDLNSNFDEEWFKEIEEEVISITKNQTDIVNFLAVTETYPSIKVEDIIPTDFVESVKEAKKNIMNMVIQKEEVSFSLKKLDPY